MKQKLASEYISQIRALPGGENIPMIYQAHMAAIETERQRDQAREIVRELFKEVEGQVEGGGVSAQREDEINGLLLLWESQQHAE